MVIQWLSHGCPMVIHGYPMIVLWLSCGYPMVIPWLSRGYPMVTPPYPAVPPAAGPALFHSSQDPTAPTLLFLAAGTLCSRCVLPPLLLLGIFFPLFLPGLLGREQGAEHSRDTVRTGDAAPPVCSSTRCRLCVLGHRRVPKILGRSRLLRGGGWWRLLGWLWCAAGLTWLSPSHLAAGLTSVPLTVPRCHPLPPRGALGTVLTWHTGRFLSPCVCRS